MKTGNSRETPVGGYEPWEMTAQGGLGDRQESYKGFLVVKCEECGEIRAFCAKHEIYAYKCRECGHETLLEGLRPMFASCKCGGQFRYKTNLQDETYTQECLNCKMPIDVRLNRRRTAYVTVGERRS